MTKDRLDLFHYVNTKPPTSNALRQESYVFIEDAKHPNQSWVGGPNLDPSFHSIMSNIQNLDFGLHRRLALLLSVIVNEITLKEDKDIRQLLTMLAVITEPNNIDVYFDPNNGGFARKYSKYLEELQKLKPTSQGISVTRKIEENQATSRTNQP